MKNGIKLKLYLIDIHRCFKPDHFKRLLFKLFLDLLLQIFARLESTHNSLLLGKKDDIGERDDFSESKFKVVVEVIAKSVLLTGYLHILLPITIPLLFIADFRRFTVNCVFEVVVGKNDLNIRFPFAHLLFDKIIVSVLFYHL